MFGRRPDLACASTTVGMNRGGFRALTGTMRPDGAFPGVVFRLDSKEGEVASHARELLVSLRLVLVLLDMEEVDGALSQHTVEITQDVAVAVLRGLAMDMATPDCFPLEPWTFLLTDVTWHPVHPSAWAPSLRVPSVPELLKFWASNVVCLSLRDNFVEVSESLITRDSLQTIGYMKSVRENLDLLQSVDAVTISVVCQLFVEAKLVSV